jgi:hypothetical protein
MGIFDGGNTLGDGRQSMRRLSDFGGLSEITA